MKREWGMIATWRMAGDAIKLGAEILNEKGKCQDAVEKAIMHVSSCSSQDPSPPCRSGA